MRSQPRLLEVAHLDPDWRCGSPNATIANLDFAVCSGVRRNIGKHIRLVQDISVWVSLHSLEQRICAIWTEALPQVSDYDLHGIFEFLP